MHFDSTVHALIPDFMREVRQDKVSAKFAIDPREQVQIERRGDSTAGSS